jgi:hypothetical protein
MRAGTPDDRDALVARLTAEEPSPVQTWLCETTDDPDASRNALVAAGVETMLVMGAILLDDASAAVVGWTHSGPPPRDVRRRLYQADGRDLRRIGARRFALPSTAFQLRAHELDQLFSPHLPGRPRAQLGALSPAPEHQSPALLEHWLSAAIATGRTPVARVEAESPREAWLRELGLRRIVELPLTNGPMVALWWHPPGD